MTYKVFTEKFYFIQIAVRGSAAPVFALVTATLIFKRFAG